MNEPLLKSIILHLVVLLILIISGWSIFSSSRPEIKEETVTVELLPISKKTNVKPQEREKKAEEKQKKEEKKQEQKKLSKKEEKKEDKPKPSDKSSKEKEDDKKKKDKKSDELESLLKDLEKEKPKGKTETKEQKSNDYDATKPLSISEMNFLQNLIMKQIRPCWNVPAGARDGGSLAVGVDIDIARNGSVKFVGFEDEAKYNSNAYYQVAADAARRAVLDPRCNPLKELPPMQNYEKWREITIEFDPSKILN